MKFPDPTLMAVTLLLLVPSLLPAQRPLFVFDNGLTDIVGHDAKAAIVAELGYQGVGWRPGDTTGMLAALDKHGVKMAATYVALKPSAGTVPVSDAVIREIDALKGQDTIVWLGILGPKNSLTDEAALKAIHTNRITADFFSLQGVSDRGAFVNHLDARRLQGGVDVLGAGFGFVHGCERLSIKTRSRNFRAPEAS